MSNDNAEVGKRQPYTPEEWANLRKHLMLELADKRKLTQREQDIQRARLVYPYDHDRAYRMVATVEALAERVKVLEGFWRMMLANVTATKVSDGTIALVMSVEAYNAVRQFAEALEQPPLDTLLDRM